MKVKKKDYKKAKDLVRNYEIYMAVKKHRRSVPTQETMDKVAKDHADYIEKHKAYDAIYRSLPPRYRKLYGLIERNAIMWKRNDITAGELARDILREMKIWKD